MTHCLRQIPVLKQAKQQELKHIALLRHAKSSWDDPELDDHDRPLAPRGARAGRLIGRYIRQMGYEPATVLCSTARRARDTWSLIATELTGDPVIEHHAELYLTGAPHILERIARLPDSENDVLLVGHNPDFQQVALALIGPDEHALRGMIANKFPTGAYLRLSFAETQWRRIASSRPQRTAYTTPRQLEREWGAAVQS